MTHVSPLTAVSIGAIAGFGLMLAASSAMAAPHRHPSGGHHHGFHGGHPHVHGGHDPHFGRPHFGPHRGHPHFGGFDHRHVGHWFGPRVIARGGRTVVVDRPFPVYAGFPGYAGYHHHPVGFGSYGFGYRAGCSTSRHVSLTPSGWHKVVTTKVCYVP